MPVELRSDMIDVSLLYSRQWLQDPVYDLRGWLRKRTVEDFIQVQLNLINFNTISPLNFIDMYFLSNQTS
jgi:hypothetical protein